MDPADFYQAVVRSLQRWATASDGAVGFDYWQGTDPSIYIPSSEYNGLSSIYFASHASADPHLTSNVLGLTQVWYNTDNGQILEADIALNDRNFYFTNDPSDTSGYGSGKVTYRGGRPKVFIENVITHEIGHAFGLSHSGGLQSTMLFMESPEQAHLGCDEQVAIHSIYPSSDQHTRGSISGSVVSDGGAPLFGAHVLAISRRRGTVLATAVSDKGGKYVLNALEPGAYFLMVEPFYAGSSSLPQYYSAINPNICSGKPFSRNVLVDSSAYLPQAMTVTAGGQVRAPSLVAHCGQSSGASVRGTHALSVESAPAIFSAGQSGFGVVDEFKDEFQNESKNSSARFYRLPRISGRIEIHALSYSLYSPIRPELELLDATGNSISARTDAHAYVSPDSGYVNYDSKLAADLPMGDYWVRVMASAVEVNQYPAGSVALDQNAFFVLTGSVNEDEPPLAATLPDNARCRMRENFSPYQSPPGNPPRATLPADSGNGKVGFCGTVNQATEKGPDNAKTPGAFAIVGWLFPWGFMAISARWLRMRSRARIRVAPGEMPG